MMTSGGQQDVLLLLFSPQRKTLVLLRVDDPETQRIYIYIFLQHHHSYAGPFVSALSPLEVTQVLAMDQGWGGSSSEALPNFQVPRRIINEFCTPGPRERFHRVGVVGMKREVLHI